MVVSQEFIKSNFPLHHLVWNKNAEELEREVSRMVREKEEGLEKLDPRGRTPLMLAVKMGHVDCATVLLSYDANAHFEHSTGWTIVHEAVCTGSADMLGTVLKYREIQRRKARSNLIPQLLRRLSDAPDFYVEMKWDFSSWVPLVSRMCPTNTHRVYKMGSCLRVDSSDNNFEDGGTGGISVIFQGKGDQVKMIEIDHGSSQVYVSHVLADVDKTASVPDVSWYQKSIAQRLSNPVMLTYVNLEKITFERNKTGIWGWGSDKTEKLGDHECKVFGATNVELVTRMRYEHLAEEDKNRCLASTNLQKILNTLGTDVNDADDQPSGSAAAAAAPITEEEYFDHEFEMKKMDVGKPTEMKTKVNKFKATVWLSENYPLNLQEQLMPIVDIMALSSSQFSKLKDFIQMQIPSGFPLKIEIPLFHLVNTCITFNNIFGMESPVPGVTTIVEAEGRISAILEEDLFEPPLHYSLRNSFNKLLTSSEEDLYLWNADESSEQIDIYQALNAPRPSLGDMSPGSEEERLLQRAIEESIRCARVHNHNLIPTDGSLDNANAASFAPIVHSESAEELQMILELSRRELEEEKRMLRDEEEMLNKVLQLSLQER